MKKLKQNALENYALERASLTREQIHSLIDRGIELSTQADLVNCLMAGGSALFPHTYIAKCGDQIAAVACASLLACQESGKNQILALGVLHPLTEPLIQSREKEMKGIDISSDPSRGFLGPGLPSEELLSSEFSLDHYLFLLQHAAKRKKVQLPKIIIRYPNLLYGTPEKILGARELQQLAQESIVVATSDLCHHGVAYGSEKVLPISQSGYDFASHTIEAGLRLLSGSDLLAYRQYCLDTLSDSLEVGQALRFLLGPLEGKICDLRLIDVSDLFEENPQPSWVAAALVALKPSLNS